MDDPHMVNISPNIAPQNRNIDVNGSGGGDPDAIYDVNADEKEEAKRFEENANRSGRWLLAGNLNFLKDSALDLSNSRNDVLPMRT
jgi:hypothetical protein